MHRSAERGGEEAALVVDEPDAIDPDEVLGELGVGEHSAVELEHGGVHRGCSTEALVEGLSGCSVAVVIVM